MTPKILATIRTISDKPKQMVEAKSTRGFDAQWNRNTARTPDQYVETMYYDLAQHKSKK